MADGAGGRLYSGKAAATRVEERRRRLLDAAFDRLASDEGWRGATIACLCESAGLNKRYFYESFRDLDELAGAVVDDLAGALIDVGRAAAADGLAKGLDTRGLARAVVGATVAWIAADPRRAKVLFAAPTAYPRARALRREAVATLSAALTAFAFGYHGASGVAVDAVPARGIAAVGSAVLIGGTAEAVLGWIEAPGDVGVDALVDVVAEMWVAIGDAAVAIATRPDA